MKKLLLFLILFFFSTASFSGSCPDGSDPVKSVSADGTYFVYNCGGISNTATSNSDSSSNKTSKVDFAKSGISSVAKANESCSTPSGYYYSEGLEFGIRNVFSQINPQQNLNLYLTTEDNLSQYQNTGKPKFFPDGEIIVYLPTQYANRERSSGTGGSGGGHTFTYSNPNGSNETGTVNLAITGSGKELSDIEKILPNKFSSFKRGLIRNGYVSNFMLTDDYSKKFSQQFNQYYKPSLVNLKSLGTIVNESFSFATMGITTHKINGKDIKFARAFGAIYKPNKQTLQYILISKKLSGEQDDSEVQKDFQNIMTGIRNCIYKPNVGSRFAENYKSSVYEGEIQEPSQDVQSESSEQVDYIEKLKEIKSLLDAGIINEEDFEKMKQKIIDNM